MELEERVIQAVAKVAKRKVGEVRLESTFDELEMDSLDKATLLFELEEMFDLSIPESALQGVQTVRDIVERLGEHLAVPGQGAVPSGSAS
ncbi:MAG: acyl carrier protein [Terriglobia bacterium]